MSMSLRLLRRKLYLSVVSRAHPLCEDRVQQLSTQAGDNSAQHAFNVPNNGVWRHLCCAFTCMPSTLINADDERAQWKVKEGDKFVAGDVLLSIETDKAEIDVEVRCSPSVRSWTR